MSFILQLPHTLRAIETWQCVMFHCNSFEGQPRHCSRPPDSNPVNWVATSLVDELWRFSLRQGEMFIFVGERHDFIDVNIMSPGKGCT